MSRTCSLLSSDENRTNINTFDIVMPGKSSLGISRAWRKDSVKIYHWKVGCEDGKWKNV